MIAPRLLPAAGDRAGAELRDAVRRLVVAHGVFDEVRRPCGAALSAPHAWALLELLDAGQALTVAELADRLAIDRTNVSRLTARMEADGELRRARAPHDARARALTLTAKGRRVAEAVHHRSASHFASVIEALPVPAEAVLETVRLLEHALRHPGTSDASSSP